MTIMKRITAMLTAGAMLFSLTACGDKPSAEGGTPNAPAEKTEVNVWGSGSDNVRGMFERLIAEFNTQSEYKDMYAAKLNWVLSGTGGALIRDMVTQAHLAGQKNTDYDVVELGNSDLTFCLDRVGEEMFEVLDMSQIPNAANIEAKPIMGEGRVQPYRGTTVVLAYNSDVVPEPPETMEELINWIKENPTRFAYNASGTGGAGESFIQTTIYNQIDDESALMSTDPKWKEAWDPGFEALKELHPYMYKSGGKVVYPNKNQGTLDLLASKEIDMCPAWADMVISQRKAGTMPESIKITTIKPSFTGEVVGMTVPTVGSNSAGGHAFINFLLTDKAQSMLVQEMAAIPLTKADNLDLSGAEDIIQLDVSNFRTQALGTLSPQITERWDNEISTLP